jgi:hypothetical protein
MHALPLCVRSTLLNTMKIPELFYLFSVVSISKAKCMPRTLKIFDQAIFYSIYRSHSEILNNFSSPVCFRVLCTTPKNIIYLENIIENSDETILRAYVCKFVIVSLVWKIIKL